MVRKAQRLDREWPYPIAVEEIPSQGRSFAISPDAAQKKAIAKRVGVVSLDDLQAKLEVMRDGGHVIQVKGELNAAVTQNCVVTLEPLKVQIEDVFEAWYADHEQALSFKRAQHEALNKKELADLPMLEEHEDPEPIENGHIDLGELVTQYLSLAINPYPQKEGTDYANKDEDPKPGRDNLRPNPFAALKNWRPKD